MTEPIEIAVKKYADTAKAAREAAEKIRQERERQAQADELAAKKFAPPPPEDKESEE